MLFYKRSKVTTGVSNVCYELIDVKFVYTFAVCARTPKPLTITRNFSIRLNEKPRMRPDLQTLR